METSRFADSTATGTIDATPLEPENLLPGASMMLRYPGRDGSLEAGIRVSGGLPDCHARDLTDITSQVKSSGTCYSN